MRTIYASDAQDLIDQVNQAIEQKFDLYTCPFVSYDGLLVQRMSPTGGFYEYQLIHVNNLDDLKTAEENLIKLGYDYVFNTIMFGGEYLQWMGRIAKPELSVRDAVRLDLPSAAEIFFENAARTDELKLVEGVRAALRLEPTANEGYVVKLPYPIA